MEYRPGRAFQIRMPPARPPWQTVTRDRASRRSESRCSCAWAGRRRCSSPPYCRARTVGQPERHQAWSVWIAATRPGDLSRRAVQLVAGWAGQSRWPRRASRTDSRAGQTRGPDRHPGAGLARRPARRCVRPAAWLCPSAPRRRRRRRRSASTAACSALSRPGPAREAAESHSWYGPDPGAGAEEARGRGGRGGGWRAVAGQSTGRRGSQPSAPCLVSSHGVTGPGG